MTTDKPLTSAQRRAAEQLLAKEEERLWQEFHKEFDWNPSAFEKQARDEWFLSHPKFAAVEKKMDAYVRRVNKRLAGLREEALATTRSLKGVDGGYASGSLAPHVEGPHGARRVPWYERQEQLYHENLERRQKVSNAILKRVEQGRHNILIATLGSVGGDLITLPTLAEIIETVDS